MTRVLTLRVLAKSRGQLTIGGPSRSSSYSQPTRALIIDRLTLGSSLVSLGRLKPGLREDLLGDRTLTYSISVLPLLYSTLVIICNHEIMISRIVLRRVPRGLGNSVRPFGKWVTFKPI